MSTNVVHHPPPFDSSSRVEHTEAPAPNDPHQMTFIGESSQTRVVHHPAIEAVPGAPLHAPPPQASARAGVASALPSSVASAPQRSAPLHAQLPGRVGIAPGMLVPTPSSAPPGQTVRGGSPNTFVTHHGPAVRPATSSAAAPPAASMTPAEKRAALRAAAAQKQRELDAMDRELAELEREPEDERNTDAGPKGENCP